MRCRSPPRGSGRPCGRAISARKTPTPRPKPGSPGYRYALGFEIGLETFLAEQNHLALPWYQHLNCSDLKDTVGNFIRQAGLWHTTSYAADQKEVLSVEGQRIVARDLLKAFELLDRVVGFFIESTRQKETEIKFPAEKRVPVLVVTFPLSS